MHFSFRTYTETPQATKAKPVAAERGFLADGERRYPNEDAARSF
jgi:hypothetical protein